MKKLGIGVVVLLLAACNADKQLFQKARLATSKGNYTQAISLYTKLVKQQPQHYAAYLNRGVLWEQMPAKDAKEKAANRKRAEQDYLRAQEIEPNSAEPYNNLGALYIDMGKNLSAADQLSDALLLNPRYFTARMNRAIAYYRMGRTTDALIDFNEAALLRPKDQLLLLNRALAYYDMGRYESAVKDLTMLLSLNDQNARAYVERARSLTKMGYPADAYADLEKAVALKPSYALAYYYMGDLMFRKGEKEVALGLLLKSKELDNHYAPTYDLMGDMLALEDPVAATSNYITAAKLDPANVAKYEAKKRLMTSEKGREQVMTRRFFPDKK